MTDYIDNDLIEENRIKADVSYYDGTIVEVISEFHFTVELDNGRMIDAILSSRLRQNRILLHINDRVQVQVISSNDRGRIVERYR